jgi:Ca-activated chloride channel family protein
MTNPQDFYSKLGIRRSASAEEIRQAYFDAARRLHPDKNQFAGETELFLDIQEAYAILSNPKRREKYDASLPPEVTPDYSVEQKILYSRKNLLAMDEPQLVYVMLELSVPPDIPEPPSPPLNLCLVLDRSTSMKGSNIEMVKNTAIQILRKLKPQDHFSVVAFSDRAEVILSAAHGEDLAKQEARIQMIQTAGGTEIYSGLETGFKEILLHLTRSQVNHIILLTDGRTYGDEDRCLELSNQAAEKGIGISSLGIGSEWNDKFLDELASRTGGNSRFLSRPQDIESVLLDKVTRLTSSFVDDVRLDFQLPANVELRYAFRLQPEAGLLSFQSPILMGGVIRECSLKVLMEFVVQPPGTPTSNVSLLDGMLHLTAARQARPDAPIPTRFLRPISSELDTSPPPAEVLDALSHLKLYRLQEQARIELSAGEFNQAAEHLTRLATHLLARGERGLAKTVLMEAENIQQKKSYTQQGEKEIKYGTRALLVAGERKV